MFCHVDVVVGMSFLHFFQFFLFLVFWFPDLYFQLSFSMSLFAIKPLFCRGVKMNSFVLMLAI